MDASKNWDLNSWSGIVVGESKPRTSGANKVSGLMQIPFPPPPVCVEQYSLPHSTEAEEATVEPSPALVAEYLRYVYTSDDKNLALEVANLLGHEDTPEKHFRIRSLIRACEKSLLQQVTKENVLGYYNCAIKIKSQIIKNACFDFIYKNRKDIWKTKAEFVQSCDDLPELMYKLLIN